MVSIPRDSFVPIRSGETRSTPRSRWAGACVANQDGEQPPDCASITMPNRVHGSVRWMPLRHHVCPTTPINDVGRHRLRRLPRDDAQTRRLRQDSGHPRGGSGPDGQSAAVISALLAAAPAVRWTQTVARYSVPHAAADALTVKRRRSQYGTWLGWLGAADPRPPDRSDRRFTSNSAGSGRGVEHDVAGNLCRPLASDTRMLPPRSRDSRSQQYVAMPLFRTRANCHIGEALFTAGGRGTQPSD